MPDEPEWFTYEVGDLVPTQTFCLQHSPQGAGWTNLHRDGSQSYARVTSAGLLFWRISVTRTFPPDHPIESESFGARLVFGSYDRARRKADRLLAEWDGR